MTTFCNAFFESFLEFLKTHQKVVHNISNTDGCKFVARLFVTQLPGCESSYLSKGQKKDDIAARMAKRFFLKNYVITELIFHTEN
jgi:hypothetical protein